MGREFLRMLVKADLFDMVAEVKEDSTGFFHQMKDEGVLPAAMPLLGLKGKPMPLLAGMDSDAGSSSDTGSA